jgi:outer membrane receptor protein involved in Fe transport
VRQSDYSTVGKVDMWRAVAEYSPIEDITFRYNRGTSVRAPNIVELFSPQSRNFTTAAVDPCDSGQFGAASAGQRAQRSVTCASMIAGYDPLTFTSNIGPGRSSLALLQGGNPLLEEESARTEQIGFVFSPRFLDNFRLSFDYFDYVVDDYISTIPIQTVFNLCYDSNEATSANPFCAFIRRDPTGSSLNPAGGVPGGVSEVLLVNANVASLKVQGYDMSIAYGFDVANLFGSDGDWGEFSARLDGTRQYKYDFKGDPSSPVQSLSRYANNAAPEWRANLTLQYARDIWNVSWSTLFVGDQIASQAITPLSAYPAHTGDYYRHDLRVRLDFTDNFSLRGGILNLTEVAPPGLPEVYQGTGQGSSIYDNRGRFFYIGATLRH